ncbi:MAG TPA: SCO family protein [Pirellulales bacterium]
MSRWRMLVWPLMALAAAYVIWRAEKRDAPLPPHAPIGVNTPDPTGDLGYEVGDFQLLDVDGQPVSKKDLDGKVWVASFFFSNCPGPCLTLNQNIAELAREFGPQGVVFVSVTVDPETDKPETLKKYAERFAVPKEQWRFLTGDYAVIEELATKSFKVGVGERTEVGPPGAYDIAHSDRLMIVDRTGKVRGAHRGRDAAELVLVKRKLSNLLKETP